MRFDVRFRFRVSVIVAALTLCAGAALAGCGNRGPLYLPSAPPVPPKPVFDDTAQSGDAARETPSTPDTSSAPLSLTPDTELGASSAAVAQPAQ